MGSTLNLINAAFSSVPHFHSLSVPGPCHVTAAVPGAAAPTAAAPAPSSAQEQPKISSAPACLRPGPALHSWVPSGTVGMAALLCQQPQEQGTAPRELQKQQQFLLHSQFNHHYSLLKKKKN